MLIGFKMKIFVTEFGHSERLKIYVNPSKIHINLALKSIQSPFKMTYSLKLLRP